MERLNLSVVRRQLHSFFHGLLGIIQISFLMRRLDSFDYFRQFARSRPGCVDRVAELLESSIAAIQGQGAFHVSEGNFELFLSKGVLRLNPELPHLLADFRSLDPLLYVPQEKIGLGTLAIDFQHLQQLIPGLVEICFFNKDGSFLQLLVDEFVFQLSL